ncbi:ribonuclease H-like domain-containing protein [Bisporella sp. PMI_857]|nr:ribonuclease H-like domain-containing protein [Bisporella sp. PMI_857]
MGDTQDLKSIQDTLQSSLIAATRTCGQISAEDLAFQRQLDHQLAATLDEQSSRLLALSTALLKSATSIAELSAPVLEDADDVENKWHGIVDVIDSLLEKTDICLDEYTGVRKRKEDTTSADQSRFKTAKSYSALGNSFRTQNLVKPQLAFDIRPDNNDNSPWKPILKTKPHATQPLEESLTIFTNDFGQQQYRHPYETEISHLNYPTVIYRKAVPLRYQPVETTSAIFVDTIDGVMEMLAELRTVSEIAVDLEHHDTRSYVGLTSLMQISTRSKDWIVDTLRPWRQELQVLNEVFANPNIIKVFHGAYMDIVWLQRDLGLYIVGLFDTHYASRALQYEGGSLAFLLKKFINFDADKKYQMADWRIRPLPEEMFFYARADTHYLLYIFDNLRNELIDRTNPDVPDENRIEIVLQKSKETSLLRYERQNYDAENGKGPGGWYNLLYKTPALLNSEQFAVFKAVHGWRDNIARIDDDSTTYIMPNHVIFTLAKLMPKDMIALLGLLQPISHNVKSRTGELLKLIHEAKAQGRDGPSMMDVMRPKAAGSLMNATATSIAGESAPKTLLALVDDTQLISEQSSFWGGAFGSSFWDSPAVVDDSDSLRLAVPLPQLSSEIFTTPPITDRLRTDNVVPVMSSPPAQATTKDEPFVLKRGNKRKSDIISDEEAMDTAGEYDISLNDVDDGEEKDTKALRRAAKLERKRQKRLAKASEAAAEVQEEEAPFDYSKAPSVMHGKNITGDRGASQQKKTFDPYSKSENAPGGLRRLQTERPGKSHTFRK